MSCAVIVIVNCSPAVCGEGMSAKTNLFIVFGVTVKGFGVPCALGLFGSPLYVARK